jgi:hypothetical protein
MEGIRIQVGPENVPAVPQVPTVPIVKSGSIVKKFNGSRFNVRCINRGAEW